MGNDPGTKIYEHPPVTEAILELRFEPSLSPQDAIALRQRLSKRYPALLDNKSVEVQIGPTGEASVKTSSAGFKGTSTDNTDVVMCQLGAFASAKLAPYSNWSAFISIARENFEAFQAIAGFRNYTRIGVRYINRIDIPNGEAADKWPSTFFNIFPCAPEAWGCPVAFHVKSEYMVSEHVKAAVQTATLAPFLIDHTSYLLDIDLIQVTDIPSKADDLWTMIDDFRSLKNHVFETAITELARRRFGT